MEVWGPGHAPALVELTDAALPAEKLTEDELLACLWEDDDPSVVIASTTGEGVVAAVVREARGRRTAFIQLLAVAPGARRRGCGRELVEEVHRWARRDQGCSTVAAAGGAPHYLWPGVDVHATPALCLFEELGYQPRGAELNMSFPSTHRAPVPEGVAVRRALDEADASAGLAFCARHWPHWVRETRRAIDHGTCLVAVARDTGEVMAFGCHSVNRLGWLGPLGTDPQRRRRGLGNALLGAIATDLMVAGLATVEVAAVGPVAFYATAAGATVSRVFRVLSVKLG